MNRGGFSIIELMVTISLCALMVTLTLVNVSFLDRGTVRSEIDKLYSVCMYVQQCALTSSKELEIVFDTTENSYTFSGRTETLYPSVRFGFVSGTKGPPSSPQKKIKSGITFKKNKIIFYPDGVISSGTVYMTDTGEKTLYALSNGISQLSHLRKYSYTGNWKLLP